MLLPGFSPEMQPVRGLDRIVNIAFCRADAELQTGPWGESGGQNQPDETRQSPEEGPLLAFSLCHPPGPSVVFCLLIKYFSMIVGQAILTYLLILGEHDFYPQFKVSCKSRPKAEKMTSLKKQTNKKQPQRSWDYFIEEQMMKRTPKRTT